MKPLGKITNFFVQLQLPKECYEPEMNGMIGGGSKRKLEPVDGLEQDLEGIPPSNRSRKMKTAGSPENFAIFGNFGGRTGTLGAKSLTWTETTEVLEAKKTSIGALIGGIKEGKVVGTILDEMTDENV